VVTFTIDDEYLRGTLLHLLRTPSPSGRTDAVMQVIGDYLTGLGVPIEVTRRGVLRATLGDPRKTGDHAPAPTRAIVVHADTIGMVVKQIKTDGRLEVLPVGTHSARFSEGAHVTVFIDDLSTIYTGTVLPLKSSGHTYNDEVDTQGVGWHQVEIRLDEPVENRQDVIDLGIQVGDFVALDAAPQITPNGYVKSRHLDDKGGVAACLAAVKALSEGYDGDLTQLPVTAHLLITIGEEVGMGATHGLDDSVAELVAVDNAVVAEGQESREDTVNIAMLDSTGPFDYHLTRYLIKVCQDNNLPYRRDVYRYYRSDAAPAIESGLETRTALVGFGVESSHGHERTHLIGISRVAELLVAYLRGPLTFADWDVQAAGELNDFPSHSVQPAEPEPDSYQPGRHG